MKIVGLDPSLTCTGVVAIGHPGHGILFAGSIRSPAPPTDRDSPEVRADRIAKLTGAWVETLDRIDDKIPGPLLIVCESRDFQTKTREAGHATDRAGLMWHMLITGRAFGALLVFVAPPSLKLYATGDGRADKPAVKAAVERRYGVSVANTDEADALTLAAMGADVYGAPLGGAPEENRRALRAADWPIIGVTVRGETTHIVPKIPTTTTTRKRTRR